MQNIIFEYQLQNSGLNSTKSDCICLIDKKIWRNLPNSSRQKTLCVVSAIANGTSFTSLGGKIVKCNPSLVRFRIGRSLRLILSRNKDGLPSNFVESKVMKSISNIFANSLIHLLLGYEFIRTF
ncbi:hypothetical protein [Aliivibrio fischeri]